MIKSLIFKNSNNDSIEFLLNDPFIIREITGLGYNPVVPQLAKGFNQNGANLYGVLEDPRVINIDAVFIGSSDHDLESKRRELANILNPGLGIGELIYENTAAKYRINAQVIIKPDPIPIPKTYSQQFNVTFLCPKPDWLSYERTQIKVVGLSGGLTFPITFPITFAETGDNAVIEYEGDNPAEMLLDFRVKEGSGTAENPRIEDEDGNYIEVNITLTAGQKILIDTNPDAPSITLVDTDSSKSDAWTNLVHGSKITKFQLTPGTNIISFSATSGDPELYVSYDKHYGGV